MGLDLGKLRARLANAQTKGGGGGGQWFKPEKGDQTIRVVPTPDNDPFKDYWFHYNVGKNRGFLCPKKNFGEECPICDFATKLWQEGTEDSKKMAKDLFARQRFFAPVLVRGKEETKVLAWGFGKTVYETLIKLCLNPEYGDITDPDTGTDLDLTYEVPGGASFPKTTLQPKRKASKLCADLTKKECAALLETVPNFDELNERKTSEQVQTLLNEWLSEEPAPSDGEVTKYGGGDASPVDEEFNKLLSDATD